MALHSPPALWALAGQSPAGFLIAGLVSGKPLLVLLDVGAQIPYDDHRKHESGSQAQASCGRTHRQEALPFSGPSQNPARSSPYHEGFPFGQPNVRQTGPVRSKKRETVQEGTTVPLGGEAHTCHIISGRETLSAGPPPVFAGLGWGITRPFDHPTVYDTVYSALAIALECDPSTADERLYNSVRRKLSWIRWAGEFHPRD